MQAVASCIAALDYHYVGLASLDYFDRLRGGADLDPNLGLAMRYTAGLFCPSNEFVVAIGSEDPYGRRPVLFKNRESLLE